jgi:hypothetical protein
MSERREDYIADMPAGLDRAIMRVLSYHVGREKAIGRESLLVALLDVGFRVQDRVARAAINDLRKRGQVICSAGGEGGGYWLAKSWEELNEYHQRELHPRAMDLLEQERSQRQAAEVLWGRFSPEHQVRMEI